MQRLTVVAAAVAAGMITFAFNPASRQWLGCRLRDAEGSPGSQNRENQESRPGKSAESRHIEAGEINGQTPCKARQANHRPDCHGFHPSRKAAPVVLRRR